MSEFTHRLPHQPWSKPSRNEQEYFRREEFQHRMAAARHREAVREQEERQRWIVAHQGHCPKCLGVWLDHEMFDRLTHPTQKNAYLTGILREVLLEWTTGDVRSKGPR